MQKEIEILYIDDEVNNLMSFKANFRTYYIIHIASTTSEAEKILTANPQIRIIFCDQRMPNELGIDFLSRIKKKYTRPVRILLTAYADMNIVIDSINKGHIFRFVRKPWDEEDIFSAIEEANKFYLATSLLDVKNEELRSAYNELDKFAYSVSHDLRDPLVGVLSAINLAKSFQDLNDIHNLLGLMETSIKKLDDYIDSLKGYYLLRRGELHLIDIDFNDVFLGIEDFYKIFIANSDILFVREVKQYENFKNDRSVVELILYNLISNAFKYQQLNTSNKLVKISVVVERGGATIVVQDNGIGIAPEHINNVFNLFYRATIQAQGSGLGLYNVKNALVKLNGKVEVNTEIGKGTTFTIYIPSR